MARGEQFNTGLTATYRFQFHKDFPFAKAQLAGYLSDLGISQSMPRRSCSRSRGRCTATT